MSLLVRRLLAFSVFACASFARAEPVHLVAPAAGETLRGGSFAELRWSAAKLPAASEEWEAFLSVDGGRYYAFRVTPHLDIDRQRFTFIVPNVDTTDARILIRTGDEAQESHFEIPESFSIVRDPNAQLEVPRLLQFGHGEAARDGDDPVLFWTDGARNGSGITQGASTVVPVTSIGWLANVSFDGPAILASASDSLRAVALETSTSITQHKHVITTERPPVPVDLLLVCRRRNI